MFRARTLVALCSSGIMVGVVAACGAGTPEAKPVQSTTEPRVTTGGAAHAPTCGGVRPAKPGGSRYTCTFTDHFNGTKLNTTKWTATNTSDNGYTTASTSALRTVTWTVLRRSRSATVVSA